MVVPGAGGGERSECFRGWSVSLSRGKSWGDGQWGPRHRDVRVLDAAKLRVTNGRNDEEHHV